MKLHLSSIIIFLLSGIQLMVSQPCPQIDASMSDPVLPQTFCGGEAITFSAEGTDLPAGGTIDWYLGTNTSFNPYSGEGSPIGSASITLLGCLNQPEWLYIMVNVDGANERCDEFFVLWTGSGGFSPGDLQISGLAGGTVNWTQFVSGDASIYAECSVIPLAETDPVPSNAILIIQSSTTPMIPIDIEQLCNTGLPIYVISYDATDCTGGYITNGGGGMISYPVSINGNCNYNFDITYTAPGGSIQGYGVSNAVGGGAFYDSIPMVNIPPFIPEDPDIDDFSWTLPSDFCNTNIEGTYYITGILNPAPTASCPEIFTDEFAFQVSCPSVSLSGGGDLCPGNCPNAPEMVQIEFSGGQPPYAVDLNIAVSGFPDLEANGLIYSADAALNICVEGAVPFYNNATQTISIPESAAGSSVSISLTDLDDAGPCPGALVNPSITVNILEGPVAMTPENETVCAGSAVQLNGTAVGGGTGMWETAGDGSFDDFQAGDSGYTPGAEDILAGSVLLRWIVNDPGGLCAPDTATTTLTILDAAEITLPSDQEICSDGDAMLNASINVTGWDIDWSTMGDGTFDDPNSLVTAYLPGPGDIVSGTVSLTVVASDPSGLCPADMATQVVSIQQEITVDTPGPIEICEGEEAMLFPVIDGNYQTVTWTTDGDGTFGNPNNEITSYLPGPDDITSGTVNLTISVSNPAGPCPPGTAEQEVVIRQALSVDLPAIVEICSDGEVMLMPAIDGDYQTVIWTTNGDGTFGNPNNEITNYLPGPSDISTGTVNLMITVNDPDGPCLPAMAIQEVNIQQAISIDLPGTIGICANEEAMLSPIINGTYASLTWGTNGDGTFGNPGSESTSYMPGPNDIMAGSTELVLLVTNLSAVCPDTSAFVTIVIDDCSCPALSVLAPEDPLCSNQGSTLDLTSLEINTDPGNWAITSFPAGTSPAQIAGSIFNAGGADPGMYEITFSLLNPVAGCPEDTTVSILVADAPSIRITSIPAYCDPDLIEVVTDISGGPGLVWWETTGDGSFLADSTLSNIYLPGVNDPQSGSFDIIASVQDSARVCPVNSDTLPVVISLPPFAFFDTMSLSVCNASSAGSVLDLTSILSGGDTDGAWQVTSGPAIDLGDPSMVDFNGIAPADITIQYATDSAVFPCTDTTYDISIQVQDCGCPTLVLNDPPGTICASDTVLVLNNYIAGSDPGAWAIERISGSGNLPLLGPDTLTITPDVNGLFELTYNLLAAPIDGCPDSVVISLFIADQISVTVPGDTLICASDDLQVNAISGGGASDGQWSTIGDGAFLDPLAMSTTYLPGNDDLANGSVQLTFTAMDGAGNCPNVTESFLLTFSDTAFAEFIQSSTSVCNQPDSGSVVDLRSFISAGDPDGTWTDLDGSGANLGNLPEADFAGVPPGSYTFTYETASAVFPCTNPTYPFEVVVEDCTCPSVALSRQDTTVCLEADSLDLNGFLITTEPGTWAISAAPGNASGASIVNQSSFLFSGADTGVYQLRYTLLDSVPGCAASSSISVHIQAAPDVSIVSIECSDNRVAYEVTINSDGTDPYISAGVLATPMPGVYTISEIPLAETLVLELTRPGTECVTSVVISPPDCDCALDFSYHTENVTCFGDADGQLFIDSIAGAVGPVCIRLEGGTCMDITSLPFVVENLVAGEYLFDLEDSIGCIVTATASVREGVELVIDLGPDLVVDFGDTVFIDPALNFIPYTWMYEPQIFSPAAIRGNYVALADLVLELTASDSLGCTGSDRVQIEIADSPQGTDILFIPNVFTPNQDQRNDFFFPQANEFVEQVMLMQVFDRWGHLVFERTDFPPNEPELGWDGTANGTPVMPGVYVYQIMYTAFERQVTLRGDITLLR